MYIGDISYNYTIPVSNVDRVTPINTDNTVDSASKVKPSTECKTCANRKYVDGSNEADVSFKTPGVIKPEEAYAKVSAHERQHVSNAIAKGNEPGAKLISASVALKMAVCPECGRTYVAGGTTTTTIRYSTKNPYDKNAAEAFGNMLIGNNIDEKV
ncbi:MAG: hypothetical protein NC225_01590 [Clostridium sp.]|nr:hypothetical protein [Clostridium sp.]MCM1398153.1 hypothetical protein [Clostridium sp.]MCM1460846.1 hypothetical protein [Bacteroides sp.]